MRDLPKQLGKVEPNEWPKAFGSNVGSNQYSLHAMRCSVKDEQFDHVRSLLSPEPLQLFSELVEAIQNTTGERSIYRMDFGEASFLFLETAAGRKTWNLDVEKLDSLLEYGLVTRMEGTRFRVSGDGSAFYAWLQNEQGLPIAQLAQKSLDLVRSAEFASRHASCSHHLSEAFNLLWEGSTENPNVSEIGLHLRNALFDIANDVNRDGKTSEDLVKRLNGWMSVAALQEREREALESLIVFAKTTLSHAQRLTHIRDDLKKGNPSPEFAEIRRCAFLTSLVCYEIFELCG